MRSFASDNNSGVHPLVMEALNRANIDHSLGYGDDKWTEEAVAKIKETFTPNCVPLFVFNGTGSNVVALQAEDLGLGSCWVQVRERFTATGMPSDEFVHGILDIPLQLQILSVIAIGHKGMERKPFNEEHLQWEKIHINKFGGK